MAKKRPGCSSCSQQGSNTFPCHHHQDLLAIVQDMTVSANKMLAKAAEVLRRYHQMIPGADRAGGSDPASRGSHTHTQYLRKIRTSRQQEALRLRRRRYRARRRERRALERNNASLVGAAVVFQQAQLPPLPPPSSGNNMSTTGFASATTVCSASSSRVHQTCSSTSTATMADEDLKTRFGNVNDDSIYTDILPSMSVKQQSLPERPSNTDILTDYSYTTIPLMRAPDCDDLPVEGDAPMAGAVEDVVEHYCSDIFTIL